MSYLGNQPATGENNSFKILDDITSYTLTFDGSSSSVVSTADNTIRYNNHRFITGQRVTYNDGGGTAIGGLSDGVYYIIKNDKNTIKLASSLANANAGSAESLSGLGVGVSHTLNVAFDGVNTKFVASYDDGTKAQMSRAAQLTISINGVIQKPSDTASPTDGFGYDVDSIIVFSTAPAATDIFWGHLVANNFPSFDISDNKVDNFTGDGNTVTFTLSKPALNNENVLVTLDGVVQYPSDNYNTRAYSVSENVITFSSAPGLGVVIQVRHIGFAGASTSSVTGFYGRTGNVGISTLDNVEVGNVESVGIVTATTYYGDGSNLTGISAGRVASDAVGVHTDRQLGINTNGLASNTALTGVGNSFQGIYISNGMIIHDNSLNGNHYIGTAFNGLMAGPVTINGALTIDGNYVVV